MARRFPADSDAPLARSRCLSRIIPLAGDLPGPWADERDTFFAISALGAALAKAPPGRAAANVLLGPCIDL